MKLVAHLLRKVLDTKELLLKDSFHLARRVMKSLVLPRGGEVRFIKMDVKDFFMSGKHEEIVRHSSNVVEEEYKQSYKELVQFLLSSQRVCLDKDKPDTYIVKVGTGMGLNCSPELSSATFYDLVEKGWIESEDVRKEWTPTTADTWTTSWP